MTGSLTHPHSSESRRQIAHGSSARLECSNAELSRGHVRLVRPTVAEDRNVIYMVVEHFKNGNALPIYRRFRERGRLAPAGLFYVSSWVDEQMERCFQLMETDDRILLDEWMSQWADLVDFEVYPVMSSAEAGARAFDAESSER